MKKISGKSGKRLLGSKKVFAVRTTKPAQMALDGADDLRPSRKEEKTPRKKK